ncbi:MAG TPA: hypothetical protein VIX37_05500 [Candidatus Sulfotelmatobacter sp.]
MRYSIPSAVEIDKKLRDDFRRRVKDFGISAELTDPLLAVLFRTFAQQLESLYSEINRLRLALLDELISNLGMEPRMSRPAQTLVRFFLEHDSQLIAAGTELVGEAQSGERLTFMTDATIAVSEASIGFALAYQDGALRLLPSVEMPEALQATRPSLEAVRVNLGPNPALFLAIENLPPDHLSQHTFFFDLAPDAVRIQEALQGETWCVMNAAGELGAPGILRPRAANAGILALEWLLSTGANGGRPKDGDDEVAALPTGFYGPRTVLFPPVPGDRRFGCKVPRAMESALAKIFGRESRRILSTERAWLRVSMPADVPSLHTSLGGITMHAVTASNVECFNQTIVFAKQGTSIPIVRDEGGAAHHLVAPLSIFGEHAAPYIREAEPSSQTGVGRYAVRNGRIELTPARRPDGSTEGYANLRLWVTNGSLGNKVDPGQVTTFLKQNQMSGLRVANPTAAAGGTDGEELSKAQDRFAHALLSRDRIVTRADLLNALRAFDSRIASADVEPAVKRTEHGLQRVERVRVRLNKDDFIDPAAEFPLLQDSLLKHLVDRFPLGTEVAVQVLAL